MSSVPESEIEEDEGPVPGEAPAKEWVEIVFTVEPNYAGWRLDKYLCHKIRRLSRTKVKEVIENSLVSERKLKPSSSVSAGMKIVLRRQLLVEPTVPPPEALRQVYLDEFLLVIDKPAGLPIHPTARYHHGTLVGQLKVRYGPEFQAHPAHRLDRETSGLLVCGRTLESSQHLSRAFVNGEVHKQYLAIVEGHPPQDSFEVDAPISEGTDLIRIAVRIDREGGKPAKTRFKVEQRVNIADEKFALVRCFPETGRQHQIRIHAQTAGFPLVGDKMYGPSPELFDRFSKRTMTPEDWEALRLPRHALHAASLTFVHPKTRESVTFESPLPEDLTAFLSGSEGF